MRADRVEMSWDAAASNWLVRIETGEEVIRRRSKAPKNAEESSLRALAQKILQDEGYEADASQISIRH